MVELPAYLYSPLYFFKRLYLTLHLGKCSGKALKCMVAGCTAIVKQKDVPRHTINAALTHTVLQEGEVQRLRGLMHFQVRYLN